MKLKSKIEDMNQAKGLSCYHKKNIFFHICNKLSTMPPSILTQKIHDTDFYLTLLTVSYLYLSSELQVSSLLLHAPMNKYQHEYVNEIYVSFYGLGVNVVNLLYNTTNHCIVQQHTVSIPSQLLVFLNIIITR